MATERPVTLIDGEEALVASDGSLLTLTNYRLIYDSHGGDNSKYVAMTLESIATFGLVTRSKPILLILGAISIIAALAQSDPSSRGGLILLGVIFGVAYLATRSAVITVSSNGGQDIVVPAKGMKREKILDFLDNVAKAKLKFLGKVK